MSPAPAREHRLVERAVAGDAEAFAGLYKAHAVRIYRYVLSLVGDHHLAEDLTSQTFLKAWEKVGGYRQRGLPFCAWLYRIARNNVVDYCRRHHDKVAHESGMAGLPDPTVDIDEHVERCLEIEWLKRALHKLTGDQKQVLTLKFLHGFSTREVAKLTGKRQGAIRALQMRGFRSLAEHTARVPSGLHQT